MCEKKWIVLGLFFLGLQPLESIASFEFSGENPGPSCTVRNLKELDSRIPLNHALDQGFTDTCYAHSAYQLLQYHYHAETLKKALQAGLLPEFKNLSLIDVIGKGHSGKHFIGWSYSESVLYGVRESYSRTVGLEEEDIGSDLGIEDAFTFQAEVQSARASPTKFLDPSVEQTCTDLLSPSAGKGLVLALSESIHSNESLHDVFSKTGVISPKSVQLVPYNIYSMTGDYNQLIRKVNSVLSADKPHPLALGFQLDGAAGGHEVTVIGSREVCCAVPTQERNECRPEWKIINSFGGDSQGWIQVGPLVSKSKDSNPNLTYIKSCRATRADSKKLPSCHNRIFYEGLEKYEEDDRFLFSLGTSGTLGSIGGYLNGSQFEEKVRSVQLNQYLNLINGALRTNRTPVVSLLIAKMIESKPKLSDNELEYLISKLGHYVRLAGIDGSIQSIEALLVLPAARSSFILNAIVGVLQGLKAEASNQYSRRNLKDAEFKETYYRLALPVARRLLNLGESDKLEIIEGLQELAVENCDLSLFEVSTKLSDDSRQPKKLGLRFWEKFIKSESCFENDVLNINWFFLRVGLVPDIDIVKASADRGDMSWAFEQLKRMKVPMETKRGVAYQVFLDNIEWNICDLTTLIPILEYIGDYDYRKNNPLPMIRRHCSNKDADAWYKYFITRTNYTLSELQGMH